MFYTRFHAIRKRCLLVRMAVMGAVLDVLGPSNAQQAQQPTGSATQDPSATSEPRRSPTSSSPPSAKNDANAEVTVQDSGTTFRLPVNLVQAHVVTVKPSFDLSPGKYLVRQVIRDSEGSQMAARNGAEHIPN
jgi:hypothetical protein